MKTPLDIDKKVKEVLDSLDGIQKAEAQPYFFTRVKARLARDEKNIWELAGSFLARPAVAIAGLCVILTINVFILVQKETTTSPGYVSENNTQSQLQEDDNIFAAANNTYEYENLEP
jgi:hypothetical protein